MFMGQNVLGFNMRRGQNFRGINDEGPKRVQKVYWVKFFVESES